MSPLRFYYDSKTFNLPIRLGLLNAKGPSHVLGNRKLWGAVLLLFGVVACTPSNEGPADTLSTAEVDANDASGADGASSDADASAPTGCQVQPQGKVSLPGDEGPHSGEEVEWWYWTGHLKDEAGAWYGFQVTFFQFGGAVSLLNVALTDIGGAVFHRDAEFMFSGFSPQDGAYDFTMGGTHVVGGSGVDRIDAAFGPVVLGLDLSTDRPPVFHRGDGRHDYSFGGYTYYYSRPRLEVSGTLTLNGQAHTVSGQAWFDHQWGALEDATSLGWDWFALQLDDGRDIMLFLIHGAQGDELVGGTVTDANCQSVPLAAADVEATALGSWTSPESGCTYPMGWSVRVGQETFTVTQGLDAQEFVSPTDPTRTYWEGAATVDGDAKGRAYVELTGYCGTPP